MMLEFLMIVIIFISLAVMAYDFIKIFSLNTYKYNEIEIFYLNNSISANLT